MWKYLKDYVIGKLLDKWIIPSDGNNNDNNNNNHFLYYKNASLNVNSFNRFLSDFGYEIESGIVEELSVDIDWMEIFRYWTEIKNKYHFEGEDDDDEEEENNASDDEGSRIKIKNLTLNLKSKTTRNYTEQSDEQISNDVNVDLMKDFLDHVISQFKVEIEGLVVNINNDTALTIPNMLISSETCGLRRGSFVKEDVTMQYKSSKCTLMKGTEMYLTRTIEGVKIKVNIPGIVVESRDGFTDYDLFDNRTSTPKTSNLSFEISLEMLKATIGPFQLIVNDIWLASSAQFLLGHCQAKWHDHLLLETPIQSHVISGNYKDGLSLRVEEEVSFRFKDFEDIREIREFFGNFIPRNDYNTQSQNLNLNLRMRGVSINIQDLRIRLHNITVEDDSLNINSINLEYIQSNMTISDINYNLTQFPNVLAISPFAEMKRFIENDEIISIEEYEVLYGGYKKNLGIGLVQCEVFLEDMPRITTLPTGGSIKRSTDMFAVVGSIDQLNIVIVLDNCTLYSAKFNDIRFLITESFFDFRSQFRFLQRSHQDRVINIVESSGSFNFTWTKKLAVVESNGLCVSVPSFGIQELIKNDMKCITETLDKKSKGGDSAPIIQVTLKSISIKLTSEVVEPVESESFIKEINFKTSGVVYLNELELKLEGSAIFNSGLLKIELNQHSVDVRNHCSTVNLTQKGYRNLLKFILFWSEIYSPEIAEIEPEAIFHSIEDDEGDNINGKVVVEGDDDDEGLELLFELSEQDDSSIEGVTEDSSSTDTTNTDEEILNTEELLRDIDEEFFVRKDHQQTSKNGFLNIFNFGIKINLKLENTSVICISLNGIDGSLSIDGNLNVTINEGVVVSNDRNNVMLNRWLRGPDVSCKHPIEDGKFFSLKAEKILKDAGIDEFNLKVSISPLRLFLDQDLLNSCASFFKPTDSKQTDFKNTLRGFIFFNKVSISPLALKLDYSNPPLQGAEMILPKIELRGVKGVEGLGPAVLSAWIPEMKGRRLTGALTTGLVPVRTVVNLGGGVVELILLPWQLLERSADRSSSSVQAQSAAHAVAQIRKSSKQIGLEALKLTTSLASTTTNLLNTSSSNSNSSSSSSAYPRDFQTGIQQAAQLIIALPTRITQQNQKKGALRAVPLLILDSAACATGALAKTLQGIQAEFDKETGKERATKRR